MAFVDGKEYELTSVNFRNHGIIFLPVLPILLLGLHVILLTVLPGIYFILYLITVIYVMRSKKEYKENSNFLVRILYVLISFTFGLQTSKRNTRQFRIEWFILFGGPILGLVLFFVYASTILIVPAIILIIYRKNVLRFAFKFALLPRSEYFEEDISRFVDKKELEKIEASRIEKDKELQYLEQNQFLHFYPPSRRTRLNAYLFLLLTPLIVALTFIIFLTLIFGNSSIIIETTGIAFLWGYVGIIPYVMLSLLKEKRPARFITTSFAEVIVSTMASSSINYLPYFNGDYYFEQNSRVIDMSDKNGFYEIFKNGRLYTIILLPLSAISIIFSQLISRAINNDEGTVGPREFLRTFSNDVINGSLIVFVLIILPLLISFILPLIWVLKDAELKRTQWEQDDGGSDRKEISSVEDLGSTINRIFSLFLGFSAITGLLSITRRLINKRVETTDVYFIVFIMIFIGAMLVLPGTLYMAYRYFSLGDHARGVNYIRYNLSQSEKIGVGTIVKGYDTILTLPEPISPFIREQIGLGE